MELLDGERDRERRIWRMAELASTWWRPGWDARWRVPPESRCGEKVATMTGECVHGVPRNKSRMRVDPMGQWRSQVFPTKISLVV